MKKSLRALTALALALVMVFPLSGVAYASSVSADPFALTPQAVIIKSQPKITPTGSIIMGSTTDVNADFLSGWSNAATNQDIKTLINGYETVSFTEEGQFVVNPVAVKSWKYEFNADGSKTYTYEIHKNLYYNDRTRIYAKDYLFNIMLSSSPEFFALKATSGGEEIFVGYDDFYEGKTKTFSGLKLIDPFTFSLTIKAEELPTFYELAYTQVTPMPMHVIAPDVRITDEGNGATFSDNYTVELLTKTILDEKDGYRYKPTVSSGPYSFHSYDAANKVVTIKANTWYLGDYDGTKPRIETVTVKLVTQATMMDELATGQVDLLTGIGDGDNINKGYDLADEGKAAYNSYPRAGFGYIGFQCDFGPTQFQAVRQAVAWCLDRDEFCRQFTKGYGIVVHGYYGASQWEYQQNKDFLESKLVNYNYNLEKAKQTLIADGWTLNSTGGAYVEGSGTPRYKTVDGKLMALEIEWLSSENNQVSNMIAAMLPEEAIKVGIKINQTVVDFATLQKHWNRNGIDEPVYCMYNLALGFVPSTSPWYYFSKDPKYLGDYNPYFILNDELDAAVMAMKRTAPTDLEGWSKKWVDFQIKFNELLPVLPLYSNLYHDFYNPKLKDFRTSPLWGFRYAIKRAYVEE